jgi:hypothetical protein
MGVFVLDHHQMNYKMLLLQDPLMKMKNSYLDHPYACLPFLHHLILLIIQTRVQLQDSFLLFVSVTGHHPLAFTRQAYLLQRMLRTRVAYHYLQTRNAFAQTFP